MTERKTLLSTSALIKKYGLNAKKSLGQNFILDKNFTDKIAKSAGNLSDCEVLEIGPGPGSLTRSILDCDAKKVFAIEKDRRCVEALKELENFYGDRLKILQEDALEFDLSQRFCQQKKIKIIANLPYNIGTVLLFKWLKNLDKISVMTLMLQKEVVERITAKPGEKNYGRLAVMINFLCESEMLFTVSSSVFTPPPKVTSAIVQITPRQKPIADIDFSALEKVVAAAFSQRRKMLRSSLKAAFKNPEEILRRAKINPELRAENLKIEDFCKLVMCKSC